MGHGLGPSTCSKVSGWSFLISGQANASGILHKWLLSA